MQTSSISSITTGPRQSNFELLRIVAMLLVLVVHADFWSIGSPDAADFHSEPLSTITRTLMEAIAIVCVNLFILVSGWFGIRASLRGFVNFAFQVFFFSAGACAVLILTGQVSPSPTSICVFLYKSCTPWFVVSYTGLYLFAPVLNIFIERSSCRDLAIFLICFYLFQTILGWPGRADFVCGGSSTFSFIGLYVLAAFLRKCKTEKYKWGWMLYAVCTPITALLYFIQVRYGLQIDAIAYASPFVVLASVGLFLVFARMRMRHSRIINWVAKSAFAVYLFHCNNHYMSDLLYKPLFQNIYRDYSGVQYFGVAMLGILAFFIAAIILDQPRKWLWKLIQQRFK